VIIIVDKTIFKSFFAKNFFWQKTPGCSFRIKRLGKESKEIFGGQAAEKNLRPFSEGKKYMWFFLDPIIFSPLKTHVFLQSTQGRGSNETRFECQTRNTSCFPPMHFISPKKHFS